MARFDLTDFEWSVIQPLLPGGLNWSSQHFVFFGKMECSDETKAADIFYSGAEERDLGSLATRRVHEFNRSWV